MNQSIVALLKVWGRLDCQAYLLTELTKLGYCIQVLYIIVWIKINPKSSEFHSFLATCFVVYLTHGSANRGGAFIQAKSFFEGER